MLFIFVFLVILLCPLKVNADTETGYCGANGSDNLSWVLEDGVLTISGEGNMGCYHGNVTSMHPPWWEKDFNKVVIEPGVTSIGSYAFSYCDDLTEVVIPEGLKVIQEGAFYYSNIETIDIPASLELIELIYSNPFKRCENLQKINVSIGNTTYKSLEGVLFNYDQTELIAYPHGKTGPYSIPEGVTKISQGAFSFSPELTSIFIPETVTQIQDYAFSNCWKLQEVSLPSNLTILGRYSFINGYELNDIIIPGNVKEIGEYAFSHCGFSHITILDGVQTIEDDAFAACHSLIDVWIPDSVTNIGARAFRACLDLESITVQTCGSYAYNWALDKYDVKSSNHQVRYQDAVEATCKESGLTEGQFCVVCGKVIIQQEVIDALGHLSENIPAISPTCEQSGLSEGVKCHRCGEILSPQIEIPRLGHDWDKTIYEWSYDNQEVTALRFCKNDEMHVENETAKSKSDIIKNPTCEDQGATRYTANFVNPAFTTQNKVVENIPALGHKAIPIPIIAATHNQNGSYGGEVCEHCGMQLTHPKSISVAKVLWLPQDVCVIEEDAFRGLLEIEQVWLPEGATGIRINAFKGCSNLVLVYIPGSVTEIEEGSFDGCDNITIATVDGSTAWKYAIQHNIPVIEY